MDIRFRLTDLNLLAICRTPAASSTANAGERTDRLDETVVELFDRFRDPLLRYLWNFGLGFPDGEELIQETFLLLYKHLKGGKPDQNLRGWLFGVAHNLALKHRSRTRRESAVYREVACEQTAVDPDSNPERQALASQYQARVLAVVGALPEQDRRCLSLRAEGLRYREIAEVLEISLGAVSLSLARSLNRIARATER